MKNLKTKKILKSVPGKKTPLKNFNYNSKTLYKKSKQKFYLIKHDISCFKNSHSLISLQKNENNIPYIILTNWDNFNLHYKSIMVNKLIKFFFVMHGLYLNKFFFRINHNNLKVVANSYGVFRGHKLKKIVSNYNLKLTNKNLLNNLAYFILDMNIVSHVKLKFHHFYIPQKFVEKASLKVFRRYRDNRFFWESLQLVKAVFEGYASSSILGGLIYTHIRRNPKRIAFLAYIKRLLNWHFKKVNCCAIIGVRIEVKGRFNAKSRKKKQIVSIGRVKIHEKSSKVDYAFLETITKFGCLGIKVWICPRKKQNVINTKKSKI